MHIIGLSGFAGAGKDTVADILVERYGWVKFSFSDELYRQVAKAFNLPNEDLLRDRTTKDTSTTLMCPDACDDVEFFKVAMTQLFGTDSNPHCHGQYPLSPRQVLQWWGTEYRRAQDPDYWVKQAAEWLSKQDWNGRYVNTSVRYPNELGWINSLGGALVWVDRPGVQPQSMHSSEQLLFADKDKTHSLLENNGSIEDLAQKVKVLHHLATQF